MPIWLTRVRLSLQYPGKFLTVPRFFHISSNKKLPQKYLSALKYRMVAVLCSYLLA